MFSRHFERLRMIQAWAAHDAQVYRSFVDRVTSTLGRPIRELRVLDLGCGANAPLTLLLHAAGCRVTGVDANLGHRWGLGFSVARYLDFAHAAGWARTCRKAIGELVYDRVYYRELARITGMRLSEDGLDLQTMDAQRPNLPEDTFDVIHSNATWEHIADVAAANRSIARALKPGGVAYIEIHLFPSLSGGHDLPWIVPGETRMGNVQPWQHLRDNSWRPPVFLNRLRERDYRRLFEAVSELSVIDWQVEFSEGNDWLTPSLLEELSDYTRRELTTRSIIAILEKRTAMALSTSA